MLDKMGKTELGESVKGFTMVAVMGFIIVVLSTTLGTFLTEDPITGVTCFSNQDEARKANAKPDIACDKGGENVYRAGGQKVEQHTSTARITEFHAQGVGIVSIIAFWGSIAGILMIIFGVLLVLLAPRHMAVLGSVMAAGLGVAYFAGHIPVELAASVFVAALGADLYTTLRSKRFPSWEANPILGVLGRKGVRGKWAAYAAMYAGVGALGVITLGSPALVLALLAACHGTAAAWNHATEKRGIKAAAA